MCSHYKKIILTIFLLATSSCAQKDQVWDVLLLGLVDRIKPDVAAINMGYYLLKQTHEPLLRHDRDGNFFSKILNHWERSLDNKNFTFCPNSSLQFNEKQSFTPEFLREHLEKVALQINVPFQNSRDASCVLLQFSQPVPKFLNILTFYENAPTVSSGKANIDDGLGAFYAESLSKEKITLNRKQQIKAGYNKIVAWAYQGRNDQKLQDHSVEDFNRVYVSDLPDWVRSSYAVYPVSLLQSINLLIDHPSQKIRQQIYHCLDVDRFRKAFMPGQEKFQNISTVLPVGVPGGQIGAPKQGCSGILDSMEIKKQLTFANWKSDNNTQIEAYFQSFEKQTGLTIKNWNITPGEFHNLLWHQPHSYHLTVVALDAVRPDVNAFYDVINPQNHIFDNEPSDLKQLSLQLSEAEKNGFDQSDIVRELNQKISEHAMILPLYQEVRDFYYPKQLKNLILGQNFLEYPEIADLQL